MSKNLVGVVSGLIPNITWVKDGAAKYDSPGTQESGDSKKCRPLVARGASH